MYQILVRGASSYCRKMAHREPSRVWCIPMPGTKWSALRNSNHEYCCILEAAAAKTINECLSILWHGPVWLDSGLADRAGQLGCYFLRSYFRLAEIAHESGVPRFPLLPKHHMLYHGFEYLLSSASRLRYVLNNICDTCPMEEDFVGKVSRFSRRAGTRAIVASTWRKYLIQCHELWHQRDGEKK